MIKDNDNKPDKNNKNLRRRKNGGTPAPPKSKNDGYTDSYINVTERNNPDPIYLPENKYYTNIADKIKLIKWIITVLLLAFVAASVMFNSRELNAGSLGYFLRYINIQGANWSGRTEFNIELDEASAICYYRNNIVSLRRNRLDIYDMSGRRNFTHRLVYSNPVIKTSERYIIAYDLGMNKMEIFNSFSRVYEHKGGGPIYGAQVTDRGNVVYITSEGRHKFTVCVMDSSFTEIFRRQISDDYIVGADIDDRADRLVTAGFSARGGDYLSRIILQDTHIEEPVKIIEVTGEQPYGVKLNQDGIFAVFENSVRFYDNNGDFISSYNFSGRTIRSMSLTEKLAAVVLTERTLGADNRILIFDGAGNILYDAVADSEIKDLKFSKDYRELYFLTRAGLYRINIINNINIGQEKSSEIKSEFEFITDEYDETTDNIIYANDRNIFLSGLTKVNIINARG